MRGRAGIWGAAVAVLALLLAPAAFAQTAPPASTIVVNSTADPGTGGCTTSECTLREAIAQGRSIDTIRLPAGRYTINGELISGGDRIVGDGAVGTIIDGGNLKWRVLTLTGGNTSLSGVTITGGTGIGQLQSGTGGGIYVETGATLDLANSVVVGNNALNGGGIATAGTLNVTRSTVSGNRAQGVQSDGVVGGIYVMQGGAAEIRNTTVSGNSASATGGGIGTLGRLVLENATIAYNTSTTTASSVGGVVQGSPRSGVDTTVDNTIIARNSGPACGGNQGTVAAWMGDHNLDDDGTCDFTATGDRSPVDPQIGLLSYNGGPTQTHALAAGSPAINAGAACQPSDQRGIARPSSACDIGAFEYVAPRLTVNATVINDSGGTATAVTYRVTRAGADVAGSPAGASGTFTVDPGAYNVSAGLAGYTVTIGGDCSPAGAVTLGENQSKTCTVTANDNAILVAQQLPAPIRGEQVNAVPARGTIKVKRPGARRFTTLEEDGAQLPVGTIVDARKGRVTIVAASDDSDGTDSALFYGGIFRIGQTKGRRPITTLTLTEKISCPRANTSAIAAAKKKKRRLWGNGKGRFRTKGKHSAATVVGTKWLVEDRCKSTLTRVVRGRVSVRDFAKKKTVIVRRGKRYTARAG